MPHVSPDLAVPNSPSVASLPEHARSLFAAHRPVSRPGWPSRITLTNHYVASATYHRSIPPRRPTLRCATRVASSFGGLPLWTASHPLVCVARGRVLAAGPWAAPASTPHPRREDAVRTRCRSRMRHRRDVAGGPLPSACRGALPQGGVSEATAGEQCVHLACGGAR